MKVYQLTYIAQVAAQDDVDFQGISLAIEQSLNYAYSGRVIIDNSRAELENDSEIITS